MRSITIGSEIEVVVRILIIPCLLLTAGCCNQGDKKTEKELLKIINEVQVRNAELELENAQLRKKLEMDF